MQFDGYVRVSPLGRRGVARFVGWALALLVLWLVAAFVSMPSGLGWGLLALWLVASTWNTVRLEHPHGQQQGHGTLVDDTVTWEGSERFVWHLIRRTDLGLVNAWGTRLIFPLLVLLWVWVGAQGHGVVRRPTPKAFEALALFLGVQSWLRPAYRTELIVATEAGRRRIRVFSMTNDRSGVV